MSGHRDRRPSSSPRQHQFSPFPFGSPITNSDRSILSPGRQSQGQEEVQTPAALNLSQTSVQHVIRGRIRAQEVYGGQLTAVSSLSWTKSCYVMKWRALVAYEGPQWDSLKCQSDSIGSRRQIFDTRRNLATQLSSKRVLRLLLKKNKNKLYLGLLGFLYWDANMCC
jgi:hypothetical protein